MLKQLIFYTDSYIVLTPFVRELFFTRNNFGCVFRFWAPTVIFENRKAEIETLFNNIAFP
jgi:hypothetical protein